MPDEILNQAIETIPDLSDQFTKAQYFMSYHEFQEEFGSDKSMTAYFGAYLKYHPHAQDYIQHVQNGEVGYASRIFDRIPTTFWTDQSPRDILEKIREQVIADFQSKYIISNQIDDEYYTMHQTELNNFTFAKTEHYLLPMFDHVFRKIYDEKNQLRDLIATHLPINVSQNQNLRRCILEGIMTSYSQAIAEVNTKKTDKMDMIQFVYLVWKPIANILNQNNIEVFDKRTEDLESFIKKVEAKLSKLNEELKHAPFSDSAYSRVNNKCKILEQLINNNKDIIKHKIFLSADYLNEQKRKIKEVMIEDLKDFNQVLQQAERKLSAGIDKMVNEFAKPEEYDLDETHQNASQINLIKLKCIFKEMIESNLEMIRLGEAPAIDYLDDQELKIKDMLVQLRGNEIAVHHNPIVKLINDILSLFTNWRIRNSVEKAVIEMDQSISAFVAQP